MPSVSIAPWRSACWDEPRPVSCDSVRALILGHSYVDPDRRGKLRALAAQGAELRVLVPEEWRDHRYGRCWRQDFERERGFELAPVSVEQADGPEDAHWRQRDLIRLVRDFRPDIVQIEEEPSARAAARAVAAARVTGAPVAVFTRETVSRPRPWRVERRRRRVLGAARGVLAPNKKAQRLAAAHAPNAVSAVIPHAGVDVPPTPPAVRDDTFAIGFVGRLTRERGLDTLIRALCAVRVHGWTLTVVGEGPEREQLEALAIATKLGSRIRWVGPIAPAELEFVWPAFDLLVLPSRTTDGWAESSGAVALEAMAHGVPVIGTTCGALPEVIGPAGIVVPENDPAALTVAIAPLARPAARAALAAAGRARALAHYSHDAVARSTLDFWARVTAQ